MTATHTALPTDGVGAFLDALAAKVPAPGGGATAALHLGQAAALVSMVARYTTGARYAEHESLVEAICLRADAARSLAMRLMQDDMAAFSAVIAAYQLPKSTALEANSRSAAIGAAAARAAAVPADVVSASADVLDLAEDLFPVANRNVISDIAAAADAARAAATTARVNVEINLPSTADPATRESLLARIGVVDTLAVRADTLTNRVRKLLTA